MDKHTSTFLATWCPVWPNKGTEFANHNGHIWNGVHNHRVTFADTQTRWSQAQFTERMLERSQDSHRCACLAKLHHQAFAVHSAQAPNEATISPREPGRMCTSMRSLLPGFFYTKWWMHPRNVVGLTLKFGIAMLIRTQMLWSKSWNGVPQISVWLNILKFNIPYAPIHSASGFGVGFGRLNIFSQGIWNTRGILIDDFIKVVLRHCHFCDLAHALNRWYATTSCCSALPSPQKV